MERYSTFFGCSTQALRGEAISEFEAASLTLKEPANAQTFWIGLGQIAVIRLGLAIMRWESRARAQEHADRHVEAMTALRTLIERTAPPKE